MEHLLPWLTLKSVPGIGNLLFNRLLQHFESPQAVLSAPAKDLAQVNGMSPRLATAVRRHRTPDWVRHDIEMARQKGYAIVTQHDSAYPGLLRQIADPPPVLYVYGKLIAARCHIAVVGSRKASSYGLHTTRRLCEKLAACGLTVVSGMARGIDTAAHAGALSGGGQTVAVLGSGLQRVYPVENLKLFDQIAENGAVISEFPLDAEPEPHHFPLRNRVISGMSVGTVVVEAAARSGSLITARLAAEQGREVFAVPGSIQSMTSQGTHDLIKQGAKLVAQVEDIIEELGPQLAAHGIPNGPIPSAESTKRLPTLSPEEKKVFAALGPYPVHIDDLVHQLGLQTGQLTSLLSQLELKGVIFQKPGKYFACHSDFTGAWPPDKKI